MMSADVTHRESATFPDPRMPPVPFKLNQARRHHIPKQKRKVVNWRDYDASLRRRGSLTVWFTEEAVTS